jgi:hypothetical protein
VDSTEEKQQEQENSFEDVNSEQEETQENPYEDVDSEQDEEVQDYTSEELKLEMIQSSLNPETEFIVFDGVIYMETEAGKQFYISCFNLIPNQYRNEIVRVSKDLLTFFYRWRKKFD